MTGHRFEATCGQCGADYTIPLSKREAAFFVSLKPDTSCPSCGGSPGQSSWSMPEIDLELLEAWASEDLQFLDQDEDLVIAAAPVSVLRDFTARHPDHTAYVADVLATKLYDGDLKSEDEAGRAWAVDLLNTHAKDWQRRGYLRDRVTRRLAKMSRDLERNAG